MKTMLVGCVLLLTLIVTGCQRPHPPTVFGSWKFMPEKSTDIASWRYRLPQLSIDSTATHVRVIMSWMERQRAAFVDTFLVAPGGDPVKRAVHSRLWPANWYMGVLAMENSERTISGTWSQKPLVLELTTKQPVSISQGETLLTTRWEYRVDPTTGLLTVREQRSSRPTPVVMVFERLED